MTITKTPKRAEPATLFEGQSTQFAGEYQVPGVDLISEAFDAVLHFLRQGLDEAAAKDAAHGVIAKGWRGSRWYVSGQNSTSVRNEAIVRDYLRGERLALLERRYGLTQRRLLQIIKG